MSYPENVLRLLALDQHRLVFLSGRLKANGNSHSQYDISPTVSFCYRDGDWAAEWETQFGPISVHHRAELSEGEMPVDRNEAKEGDVIKHHVFPYIYHAPLDWSQLAVDRCGLPQAFLDGRWAQIFNALRRFTKSRIEDAEEGEVQDG